MQAWKKPDQFKFCMCTCTCMVNHHAQSHCDLCMQAPHNQSSYTEGCMGGTPAGSACRGIELYRMVFLAPCALFCVHVYYMSYICRVSVASGLWPSSQNPCRPVPIAPAAGSCWSSLQASATHPDVDMVSWIELENINIKSSSYFNSSKMADPQAQLAMPRLIVWREHHFTMLWSKPRTRSKLPARSTCTCVIIICGRPTCIVYVIIVRHACMIMMHVPPKKTHMHA